MKSILTAEEQELAAVAAAIAATCQPCLKHHVAKANELGISKERLRAVATIGRGVRSTPERHIDDLAEELIGGGEDKVAAKSACCG